MRSSRQIKENLTSLVQRAKMKFESRAVEDLAQTIEAFSDLIPSYTNHQFPDGVFRWCISLSGTIPINYKGSTYHIPIALFFKDNHPYNGPFCYVRPTSSMRIRVSEVVDEKGRIYLPYLAEWRYPGHDTCGLLQIMTISFQEKSPMYSISSSYTPAVTTTSSIYPAANPPYPVAQNTAPYSTSIPHPMPQQQTPYMDLPYPNSQPQPYGNTGSGYQPPYQPYTGSSLINNSATTIPHSISTSSLQNTAGSVTGTYGYNTVQSIHIRASLVTAIEDKIRNRLRDKIGNPFAELQSIDINLQELRAGQQKLREMLEKIDTDQAQLDSVNKKEELEKALETCKNSFTKEESSIDDAIDATTPLHRQIFRCYAQDCAIDDTIYFLGQALKKGIINIQIYLKYVRQLSRKQFVYRATLQKCRIKAKLPI